MLEGYALFSYCLGGISFLSICLSLYTTRKNAMNVKKQAQYSCEMKVQRFKNKVEESMTVNSSELVPGDIICLPELGIIPCDCILIRGASVMNESMLTGESIPALKQPIPYSD